MKPALLLMFAISSTATATTILNYDWQTEQLSLSTQVNSGLTYNMGSGSFSGTFSINFSGLGSIDTPELFLTIPVDFSFFNDGIPYDDYGSACEYGTCYNSGTGLNDTYLVSYSLCACSREPLLVPISLTTFAEAQAYQSFLVNFATTASATVTVDFGDLVLKDALGNNVTSEVSFTVTPPGSLSPEPSSFVLAGAGLLALAVHRIRVLSRRN